MKKTLFLLFIVSFSTAFAQTSLPSLVDDVKKPTIEEVDLLSIPPLDSLYKWAEQTSFIIKQQDALIEKTEADTRRVKKQWLSALQVSANIRGGTYGNAVVNQMETGYTYGPILTISLYDIVSHNDQVEIFKAEEKVAGFKREEIVFETNKVVAILYNSVQAQKKILKIKSESVNSAYIHVKMAEREFAQGSVEVGELSRVPEI